MCSSLICNVLHIHICLNALYINVSLFFAAPHMDPAVVAVTSHPMGHPTSTPQSDPTQISSQTYTNQGFPVTSQQKLSQQAVDYSQTFSQSLQSDSLFQSTDNGSSQMSQNVLNQNVSDSTISQFEMPPQIPMPPGQVRNVWMTKQVIIRWKSPQFYTYAYLYFNVQISRVKM